MRKIIYQTYAQIELSMVPFVETIKTKVVAITPKNMSVSSLEKKLRLSNSHIIARIYDNKYILDVRTIFEEEFEIIANELKKVLN